MKSVPGSIPSIICWGVSIAGFIVNKTTKRALKWLAGILVTAVLCWHLYTQIRAQAAAGADFTWWPEDTTGFFIAAALLLTVNACLEAKKWQLLIATAMPATFGQALSSMLTGIAVSILTPNRIGEYPARIIALKQARSTRLISVSVLGACAQLLSLMIAGFAGLIYYSIAHPTPLHFFILGGTAVFTFVLGALYFSFERWAPRIEHIRFLRKLHMWARLLHRFTPREQWTILGLSILRFGVFTLQYWLLLHWQGVPMPLGEGFLLCALFFWAMAIIPSIALAELGIRGTVSIFLFAPFTQNIAGIAAATFILWCINLVVPALAGAVLFFRNAPR
jgi:MFS family permease